MTIIAAEQLSKAFTIAGRQVTILDRVSLTVAEGEFLVVQGSSGSGKTTLLSLLSGLDKPDQGKIIVQDRDITHAGEDDLAQMRNTAIGFVFQSFHLVPSLTALENVMFPAQLNGDRRALEKARALIDRVGLSGRQDNYPHQLSGGEKQRTAICRALINRPAIVFADEPTGNLDSVTGQAILELLTEFHRERRSTLVMVTHNAAIAHMADRVVTLTDGRLGAGTGDVS